MWEDVKYAARVGVILGVKFGIALVIVIAMVGLFVGDYEIVRQRSYNGQLAFEFLQQREAEAAKAKAPVFSLAPSKPEEK